MRLLKKTTIPFLSIRNMTYIVSSAVILAGLASVAFKGLSFGIDFLGGTEIIVEFDEPIPVSDIRNALTPVGLAGSEIKTYGADNDILIRTTEEGEGTLIGDRIKGALTQGFPDKSFEVLKEDKIGPKVGEELRSDALSAIIWSLVAILGYIAIRFKFVYGMGAVLAIFHDVLVTLGIISLLNGVIPGLNLEITQEVIAAFLTLIGVSVNDTVVIFDRIRENEKIYRSMSLESVLNKSLNDTLSRTIITSGTIFIVLLVLLVLGGEVNRGFAFTLTIGILTGTYSSVYVASAIVLDWKNRVSGKKRP
jgi:preprotein translocase SecF subunit